jgi:hypothetical protein
MAEFFNLDRQGPPFVEQFTQVFPRDICGARPKPGANRIEILPEDPWVVHELAPVVRGNLACA